MSSDEATSVRVALRIRPQLAREKIEACRICTYVTPGEPQVTLGKDKSFTYDYVFDTPTEQETVYESCVKTLVEGCFEGYNATVLAYGQTGSGKTYTMGTGFDIASLPEQLGIIPRAMEHLFRGINKRKDEAKQNGFPLPEFTVSAQFLELYNEELIDLFDTARDPTRSGRSTIRIHEDATGSIYTVGVTSREVSSAEETLQCLQTGALNRTTAATRMNSQSSRSHAIFSVFVKQTRACIQYQSNSISNNEGEEVSEGAATNGKSDTPLEFETLTAKFHFTDLAGSERLKRTGATGDRAKEGISINCGLLALGNVISALGDPGKRSSHVPYRDSKLTRLLQDSLGGNSCTLMVACISPSDSDFMETLSTLNYANRARNIKNKVVANQDTASKQIQVLRQQLAALQLELTEYKTGKRIVGEGGVEAYNDMFQENNILQKEVNNFRMKIKAMQETLESRNQQVIALRCELDRTKLNGGDGESNGDVVSLVGNYVKEIEELRSKLVESEALCSSLRRRSDGISSFAMHRSPTPSLPVAGSFDFDSTYIPGGKSVIELAKEDLDKLAVKKENLKKRQLEKVKEEKEVNPEDESESKTDVTNGNGTNGCEQITTDDEGSELETVETSSSDEDDNDEATEALQIEVASITYEIDVKQQLVNELESQQRRISSMQRHYEDKLKMMAQTIRATELERDKVLKNLDPKSGGNTEKSNKIKADYQKQIDRMKKDMNKLQEVKKKHDRLMREQSRHAVQLKSLRNELEQMKKTKTRLMKQMKEEQKKNKLHETKRMREIMKLKREMKMKANEVRTLTSKNRQKELMMKRKQEEVAILRKQLKPISGKYGKQQQLQQLKQQEVNRGHDSTYVVDKKNGEADDKARNEKRPRKQSSEFSSRTARLKLKTLQSKINESVVRRETISNIDRQMERLLKHREELQRDIEKHHRKQSKAIASGEDESNIQRLKDEEESLQQTNEFVNEQIQECQLEIMQVEEAEEDNGVVSSIVQYCSVNEARYIIENLISTTVSKSAIGVQMQNRLKDMETRLNASEESAKQAHDLMRYILQERPNLDSSIAECLSEYMKGAISDSASSRESSPDRIEDEFFQDTKNVFPVAPLDPPVDNSSKLKPLSKEMKARRRTATPQELLHGMPSPIPLNMSPMDSPSEEKTFIVSPTHRSLTLRSASTPEAQQVVNKTNTLDHPRHNGVHETTLTSSNDDSNIPRSNLHSTAIKSSSSPPTLPNPTPSESPPGSPLSSRSKSSVPSNVFSRLTTYALSSPRNDKGRMNPSTGKSSTPRGAPLTCSHIAEGHHKPVLCVEATDHLLFSGSKDRTVKVWNLVTCQEIMTLSGHPNNVNVVRYCQSTGLVYTVSLCYIKVWDIRSQAKCIRVLSSSGGHQLPSNFTNTVSRTIRMPDNESIINDVTIRDDGKMLFCATTTNVKIWDMNKFSVIGKLTGHSGNVMTMVVPPNKKDLVITGAKDHFIKVYDLSSGVQGLINPSMTLEPPHMDGVESLAYSSDENVLFSGSRDKSMKKWDMNTKTVMKSEYQAHSSWVCALDITRSNDGDELLVSGGRDGVVKLWDLKSFGSIGSFKAHSDTVNDITSNKNNVFTASSDRTVSVWKQSSQ